MSNVLIGILAIVLFMVVAIGSAIFLGPQFDDAQSMGAASSAIQAVSEVATGVNTFRMATGYTYGAGLESAQRLVDAGVLRRVPENPVISGRAPQIIGANGNDFLQSSAAEQAVWVPRVVVMSLGADRLACTHVMRMLGHISGEALVSESAVTPLVGSNDRTAGCFRASQGGTGVAANDYVAFARIGG